MAAKRHVEVVIPELFDIYFDVIPDFYCWIHFELLVTFKVSLKNKFKMAAIWVLNGIKSIAICIRDTYKLSNK